MSRPPRAVRLDDPAITRGSVILEDEPMDAIEQAEAAVVPVSERRRAPWGTLLFSAVSGLVLLALGLAINRLIFDLLATAPALGWIAIALAALAAIALLALVGREFLGVLREERIEKLRTAAVEAIGVRDHTAAKRVASQIATLYARRSTTRAMTPVHEDEILEPDDRLALAEHIYLAPLDEQAKRAIAAAAKQVSLVTAVSPRAIIDVAFVIYAATKLLRTLARIYGGRPGFVGFLRLARSALDHLAVTGGVAVGDSLLQQVLGLGLAARVSAKLGEGVLNGLMTARFGLAALAVCRPLPFIREPAPKIGEVAGELLARAKDDATR
ncbi:TIGR01620 family protein [Microvirga massiliensis]|uniref:TIGR01620 family protein n=1 Tax=Microvirga massiliensis TaxID=1033741 RepID=UPI00062B62EF|nr:TIGR01620 family protein [Microvirga massiliensis]